MSGVSVHTWGVTPETIASRVQSLRLTEDSSPSTSDVSDVIREHAAYISAQLRDRGVSSDPAEGGETYEMLRGLLVAMVILEVDTLRGRKSSEMASAIDARMDRVLRALSSGARQLGEAGEQVEGGRVQTVARHRDEYSRATRERNPAIARIQRGRL